MDMNEKIIDLPVPKEDEKHLTRAQRRFRDRINEDANKLFVQLTQKFIECFMANDPDSDIVILKLKEVNAKWRMYCKGHNLIPDAFIQMETFCKNFIEQYKSELNGDSQTRSIQDH